MKIDFAVVCDYAVIDQYGKLSVMGIFHHIWVSQFPSVHPRLHLVIRLKGARTEIGEHKVNIKLVDEEGIEIITGDGTVSLSEPPAGVLEVEAGAVLVFDVPFEKAGRYEFQIEVDSDVRSVVPITVSLGPGKQPSDFANPH
ncbi:MAG: hypothetical protein JSW51_06305 [Gemmatimonadota bacterium]|nr:MAG: hypothetical protein JSW51_06305 [Gemmatimonadota bacterium]